MVLGDPESVIAELFGGLGHSGGLVQGLRRRGAGRHRREVENGKGNHASFTLWSGSLLYGAGSGYVFFVGDGGTIVRYFPPRRGADVSLAVKARKRCDVHARDFSAAGRVHALIPDQIRWCHSHRRDGCAQR